MSEHAPHLFGEYANAIVRLAHHHVEFVVCGGLASVFYGVPRMTADIDILVRLDTGNLRRFVTAAEELGMKPRAPVSLDAICDARNRDEWIRTKGAKVMTFVSSAGPLQIDVFLEYPLSFDDVFADARIAEIDDVQFRISSVKHLITAKKAVDPLRETDRFDLGYLTGMIDDDPESAES